MAKLNSSLRTSWVRLINGYVSEPIFTTPDGAVFYDNEADTQCILPLPNLTDIEKLLDMKENKTMQEKSKVRKLSASNR